MLKESERKAWVDARGSRIAAVAVDASRLSVVRMLRCMALVSLSEAGSRCLEGDRWGCYTHNSTTGALVLAGVKTLNPSSFSTPSSPLNYDRTFFNHEEAMAIRKCGRVD